MLKLNTMIDGMMKMENISKILFFTDSHLNHPKLKSSSLVGRLVRLVLTSIQKEKPDAVVFGGDFFDRPTVMTGSGGKDIIMAMVAICGACARRGIPLRVVNGTGSHDGTQNDHWKSVAKAYSDLDFKLYTEIDVINDLGYNILIIPDGVMRDHKKIELTVRAKLIEKGLTKVDMMFSHGMFTHHLDDIGIPMECHDSDYYNGIIDIIGLNGHIHRPSLYGRILTGGSTDRFRQGENHPKGLHVVDIDRANKSFKAKFIENIEAAIFNSYDIDNTGVDASIDRLTPVLGALEASDIYVRLHYRPGVSIRPIESALIKRFPKIIFDSVPNEKEAKKARAEMQVNLRKNFEFNATTDLFGELLEEKFARSNLEFTDKHRSVLKGIMNGIT